MSNFTTYRSNEDELTSSSDEKMDTGSESFRSQDTPNSILSSDFEDEQNVLRLQNPNLKNTSNSLTPESESKTEGEDVKTELKMEFPSAISKAHILRLNPEQNDSLTDKLLSLNIDSPKMANSNLDSAKNMSKFVTEPPKNMSKLIDSPKNMSNSNFDSPKNMSMLSTDSPRNLGISPPKFSSTLTLTTDHPLMGPDDFPDLIPKKIMREDDKDLSLSSIEDERNDMNLFYSPQRNTSKNNLYFSENFVTTESHILNDSELRPDVAKIKVERRMIKPKLDSTPKNYNRNADVNGYKGSARKGSEPINVTKEEFHSGVAEWCESPSQLRNMPNFELPIEMSSAIGMHNDLESPDVVSSSTHEEKSAYQALLDPYTGSVALRPTAPAHTSQRRKIMLPEEDRNSLDSASSMELEEEPPQLDEDAEELDLPGVQSDDDDDKGSRSTNTVSYTSSPIPEYSLREERSDERGWVSVGRPGGARTCDVKVIEPYKRVLSHGGYTGAGAALIVFSACHLPDNSRGDYTYVMDNLFLYVIWTLERLVTDEYIVVYLHGSAGRRRMPPFHWLHECYKLIDRRLRKNLKQLYLVHPTFWLKTFVLITKHFVSSKFFKKLTYVKSLNELMEYVPVDPNAIPDLVKQYDAAKHR